ncbi:MAG TPA: A/G-specific adenine glycosylase, partial [Acidobacteriota bacterium]|nr:A/G-specific adenine glycosylase [Acidobacteriota bacterium]
MIGKPRRRRGPVTPRKRRRILPKTKEGSKSIRAPDFARDLLRWYARRRRVLPWRRTTDRYAIWISEIMLQQTTVNAVIPHYERWLEIFPDVRSLARAPLQKVLKAWQGLGYYARARNLRAAAKIIVKEHGGNFPRDREIVRRLPGFGPYTTAAVLSLVFGEPLPVIDANVRRVVMRLARIHGKAGSDKDAALMAHILTVFPPKRPGAFNQAMMELGALVCKPRSPQCLLCPVSAFCRAYEAGEQEIIPAASKRSSRKIEAVVAVIERDGRYLIQKRPSSGLLAGLWEFPGGKREKGETLEDALAREVREELGVEIREAHPLVTVRHAYTEYQ